MDFEGMTDRGKEGKKQKTKKEQLWKPMMETKEENKEQLLLKQQRKKQSLWQQLQTINILMKVQSHSGHGYSK